MSEQRLAKLAPADLDPEQRALYDAITGGPRADGPQLFRLRDDDGALEGPFNGFLLQPGLGAALQAVGVAVRYRTGLTDRAREIAVLVVAAYWDSAFEWHAHSAVARGVGLEETELEAVRTGRYECLVGAERVIAATAQRLAVDGDLDDGTYAQAVETLGREGLFELLTLVGYYAALALQLRVFRVGAPAPGTAVDTGAGQVGHL